MKEPLSEYIEQEILSAMMERREIADHNCYGAGYYDGVVECLTKLRNLHNERI